MSRTYINAKCRICNCGQASLGEETVLPPDIIIGEWQSLESCLVPFCIFTVLGAGAWNCVLAILGYVAQGQQDLIDAYSHELSVVIMALFALLIIYFVIKAYVKKNKQKRN